jgi:hypothetical protein
MVFEVRRASDGGLARPVFSSLDQLTGALGPDQPWVALPLHNIQVAATRVWHGITSLF